MPGPYQEAVMPTERIADVRGRTLRYLDPGVPGRPVLALHGHFGRARAYAGLIAALSPRYRCHRP